MPIKTVFGGGGAKVKLSRRVRVAGVTVGAAAVEWLLFELLRVPKAPGNPNSLTLLGQEKYAVVNVMLLIAAGWLLYVFCDGLWPRPTVREVVGFAALVCAVAVALALAVIAPPWPVVRLELIFK